MRAKQLGAEVVVVDGHIQDLAEHLDNDFAVFATGTSIIATEFQSRASQVEIPVTVSGTHVKPGDIILADEDGVVCISANTLDAVVEMLPRLVEADDKVKKDVQRGVTVAEAFQ